MTNLARRLGTFDAVASLGAFEHFCSPEEHAAGRQEAIYGDLFARIAGLLPEGGRLYLQTMVFGRNMIPADQISIDAPVSNAQSLICDSSFGQMPFASSNG